MIPNLYNSLYCNGEEREFTNVRHEKVVVNEDSKVVIVGRIMDDMIGRSQGIVEQVVVFVNQVTDPNLLHQHLIKWGVKTPRLAPADQRDDYLVDFRAGRGSVLITSDRMPLGYDVSKPVGVIFFDIPTVPREASQPEPDYSLFHHIAGRAGKSNDRIGRVVTLLDQASDFHLLDNIEQHFDFQASQVDRYGVNMIS
ncbi:hypothetical protein CTI12_AA465770 [Artemisia annua]|uniref:Helicase C-terminal domain-containing protein n=1 Tax=Artemisia annua TaxID=35608 RepID=A0A2U1LQ75_ARTAN|nr:hypothetical protein CTI12_AA465770 [Artemisia annua]